MYVCICNKVTDSQIREASAQGAHSMDCLRSRLKVATCCGRCEDCAHKVLNEVIPPQAAGVCTAPGISAR